MDYETVTFEVQPNGIATMTLNRPNQLNCFTQKMLQEWGDVISRCAYDNKIKVLVVTGAGRAFSSPCWGAIASSGRGSAITTGKTT